MDRLTINGLFCDIGSCSRFNCNGATDKNNECDSKRVYEKLRQYEDTGLTPDEIEERINHNFNDLQRALLNMDDEKYIRLKQKITFKDGIEKTYRIKIYIDDLPSFRLGQVEKALEDIKCQKK